VRRVRGIRCIGIGFLFVGIWIASSVRAFSYSFIFGQLGFFTLFIGYLYKKGGKKEERELLDLFY
jgi:hypothetical protein